MNKTPAQAKELIEGNKENIKEHDCEIFIGVPFVDLSVAIQATKGTDIKVGAQNCHFEKSGAFTGEISAEMLKEIGCDFVILGHSERRQYFAETDETVNKRLLAALAEGLKVVLCVGETLDQREKDITGEVVSMQTKVALKGVSADDMKNIIIAYEPVWAIGTGKTATSDQAEEVCAAIREVVASIYNAEISEATSILYGGSMNMSNAEELLSKTDVDGGLIGGASLKPVDFAAIIEASNQ